jgi:DNA processing protein
MTDRECCIALNSVSGIGYVTFTGLIKHFGSLSKIAGHTKLEYMQVKRVGEKLASELENTDLERAMARERDLAAQHDISIIAITDPEYPAILRGIPSPPIVLYVAGKLPSFERSLGVVGSREIT